MKRTPWIGITTYHRGKTGFVKLPGEYGDAVRRSGGVPVLIQPGEQRLDDLLQGLDGLIFSGGGDVEPARYSAEETSNVYGVNAERDTSEIELVRAVLHTDCPVLCICRGMQVLNVALGGSLIGHIPDAIPDALAHRTVDGNPTPHAVAIDAASRLAAVLAKEETTGASWHHQAVDRLGNDLLAVAHAADGIVEAVELSERNDLLAVQWHPELTAEEDPDQQGLFDWLVDRAVAERRA